MYIVYTCCMYVVQKYIHSVNVHPACMYRHASCMYGHIVYVCTCCRHVCMYMLHMLHVHVCNFVLGEMMHAHN